MTNLTNLSGKWFEILSEESQKDYFQNMIKWIDNDKYSHRIFPPENDWFKALELTPFEHVKVVILGQDPYHEENQAHGLAFSVQRGIQPPPSLINIYKEIEQEFNINMPKNYGNLQHWADQGVLLLNTVLTVQEHNANSHKGVGWENLTDRIIKELDSDDNPKVFILWGSNAKKKKELLKNNRHLVLESVHPSPLSANRGGWFGNNHFIKTNEFLKNNNIKEIDWKIEEHY